MSDEEKKIEGIPTRASLHKRYDDVRVSYVKEGDLITVPAKDGGGYVRRPAPERGFYFEPEAGAQGFFTPASVIEAEMWKYAQRRIAGIDSERLGWMSHPLSGDIPANIAKAKRWFGWLLRNFPKIDFLADWILWAEVLDDTIPENRERGLRFDEDIISRLDGFWLVGNRISGGMERERKMAEVHGLAIVDLTPLGFDEPPGDLNDNPTIEADIRLIVSRAHEALRSEVSFESP